MKRSDSIILLILPVVALIAGFWLLVLAPKRQEAAKLGDEVSKLREEVDEQKRVAAAAALARDQFTDNYQKVVSMGRAVPADADTPSLFAQFSKLSERAGVDFRSIELDASSTGQVATPPATPPPPAPSGNGDQGSGNAQGDTATPASSTTPPPATEASAAALPIGATVGPAGFPVMPYKLQFTGDFFNLANFIHELDQMVGTKDGLVAVRGRLLTIDGFSLGNDPARGFPSLVAEFHVTTYLTPSAQGVAAGATPTGPGATPTPTAAAAPGSGAPATPTSGPTVAPGS